MCVREVVDLGLFELVAQEKQDKSPVTARESHMERFPFISCIITLPNN